VIKGFIKCNRMFPKSQGHRVRNYVEYPDQCSHLGGLFISEETFRKNRQGQIMILMEPSTKILVMKNMAHQEINGFI
jgi:hypothetical protein